MKKLALDMIRLMDPQMVFQIPKPTRLQQCGFQLAPWTPWTPSTPPGLGASEPIDKAVMRPGPSAGRYHGLSNRSNEGGYLGKS